jgi:hypothetical protein
MEKGADKKRSRLESEDSLPTIPPVTSSSGTSGEEIDYKTMMDVVIIPADLSKDMTLACVPKEYTEMARSLDSIIGASTELHVSAYFIREQLPTDTMKSVHEKLTFACDEAGAYKPKLEHNTRASHITGLKMKGPVVMFMEQDIDDELGNFEVSNLTLKQVQDLWEATQDLTIY